MRSLQYPEISRGRLQSVLGFRLRGTRHQRGYPQGYSALATRVQTLFLQLDQQTVDRVLEIYRAKYGEGAYAYARRTLPAWRNGKVKPLGQTVLRLLEIVPSFVAEDTKFELVALMRKEVLAYARPSGVQLSLPCGDDLQHVMALLHTAIVAQLAVRVPPNYFEVDSWLSERDVEVFLGIVREAESRMLSLQALDFLLRVRLLQRFLAEFPHRARIVVSFESPVAKVAVRVIKTKNRSMSDNEPNADEHSLLAKWSELELESRFRAGEVSYPEYVLRNMDQFFTPEEQSELRKLAATHGLELEKLLMEIQIKSRTSDADLQKLLATLKALQDKGISADVVSRHETPSGHIEIVASSRKRLLGCLPWLAVLAAGIGAILAILCA